MIAVIKAIHLIIVMLLIGGMAATVSLSLKRQHHISSQLTIKIILMRALLWLLLLAGISGTLLVHPRHFTLHTPWIIAAYVLLFMCATIVQYLYRQQRNLQASRRLQPLTISIERCLLTVTALGLIVVVHDAVTKHTLF